MVSESAVDASAPNLNLTPDEKRVYGQLFRQADTDNVNVVTGEVAVKFFDKTRLDSRVLGEIWQIADKENRGFLTPAGFGVVLRLIGHAQAGREPTAELALQPAPIPRFDGFTPAGLPGPAAAPAPIQAQGTGNVPIRIPPLTPDKVAQYSSLFERQNLQNGSMLPGDQARSIFEKSGLPNETLGRIWQLADTEQRGALVLTEFVIAMHLLLSMKSGALRALPNILPAGLYEAATRRITSPRQSPQTTGMPPVTSIPRQLSGQMTGQVQGRMASPLGRNATGPQAAGADWAITPEDKARFDQFYDTLDKNKKGFITGEEAVPFLSQSKLPEDALAQIWDLADINSQGQLNRDTFAIAMYLIRQQRMKRDGSSLPTTLPPNLIPPSMRTQARPTTAHSAFEPPPPPPAPPAPPAPAPKSALDDLFGLDSPAPPPAQMQTATGGSNINDPFGNSTSPMAPSSPARASPTTNTFRPFVPSSSFGRGLTQQATGESNSSASAPPKPVPAPISEDLLGDADPEISSKLNNDTTELANLSNQIGSLSKQTQQIQAQSQTSQNELNQASVQKKNFEQRLAQLRTMYEKEAKDVRELQQQLNTVRNDTKKLQTEMAMLEGSHQDLQNQHNQVTAALQADQQENASLRERIRAVNAEVAQLKPQIEKLKSEARQQKGLVAINKKQLSTVEGERDKLKTEVDELSRQSAAASPVPAQVASPSPSSASANNPFFKRTGSTDIMGAFASPGVKPFDKSAFDDVFGPVYSGSQTSTPPPTTSFSKPPEDGSTASADSFATPATGTPSMSRQATAEPPAQNESKQTATGFMPFGGPSESVSSSRPTSPPIHHVAPPIEAAKTGQSVNSASAGSTKNAEHITSEHSAPGASGPTASVFDAPAAEDADNATSRPGDADPFSAMDQTKAKADFDNAFASFKTAKTTHQEKPAADPAQAFSTFNSEFPPISELERDDYSESDSDQGGFDDDFTPVSPGKKGADKLGSAMQPKEDQPESPTSAKSPAPESAEQPSASDKPSSPAPAPNTTSPGGKSDDPFSPNLNASTSTATPSSSQTVTAPTPAVKTSTPFDDLEDDFEGLEDAKEGSTADDDFANISRSGLDDFNHVFDSSPPQSQAANSQSTTFGGESSFDFASLSSSTAGPPTAAGTGAAGNENVTTADGGTQQSTSPSDAHDWDAIFATLDSPGTTAPEAGAASLKPEERPNPPGRALTEEGKHDDPILKNLTNMGYSRNDAVAALEKYDYNLERAANFLANHS